MLYLTCLRPQPIPPAIQFRSPLSASNQKLQNGSFYIGTKILLIFNSS